MVETLLDKPAHWLAGDGPEAGLVFGSHAVLARNLSDFPFPVRCSEEERCAIEERVLGAIDRIAPLAGGQYCSLQRLQRREARFLLERRFISPDMLGAHGPRGVFVAEDQSASVMINASDHLVLQVFASGLQLTEVWDRLNVLDEALSQALDFSFHPRLGYLTSALGLVGTGLRCAALLHLPGLTMMNQIEQRFGGEKLLLEKLYKTSTTSVGDMYTLTNQSTLGQSEEEIIFQVRHRATEILAEEGSARDSITNEMPHTIQDRVGRALGVARGAHLLELDEALMVLSALRLGLASGNLEGYSLQCINELHFAAQPAHLEMKVGHGCSELALSMERADLFRARFS